MSVLQIENIDYDEDGIIYVTAIVEDAVMTRHQTLYDPPEYGPALCVASFELSEDEILPDDDSNLIQFLEKLDLDWDLIDTSDF